MDKLGLLEVFSEVARTGSFAQAAVGMGASPSTISKAIARLESHLEFSLFVRSTRRLRLTPQGQLYLDSVRTILQSLADSEHRLRQSTLTPQGVLSINAPVSYGRLYMLPLLTEFRQRFPELDVNVSFSDHYRDTIEEGFDLSIRSGQLKDNSLIGRQLSPIDFLICAAPDFLHQRGVPGSVTQLMAQPWIRFRFKQTGRIMPVFCPLQASGEDSIDPGRQYVVDDGEALAQLAAQGLGLVQLPHFIARNWLLSGQLVSLYPAVRPPTFGVFAVYPMQERTPAKITAFLTFLQQQLAAMGEDGRHTWVDDVAPLCMTLSG